MKKVPYVYQEEAVEFALSNISTKDVLIAAAPNAGKTFIASIVINKLIQDNKRILCSVHGTNVLKEQFYEEIIKYIDSKYVSIYITKNLSLFDASKPIQIVIPQNKKHIDECVSLYGKFDVLVVDEAHKYYKAESVQYFSNECVSGFNLLLTGSPESFKTEIDEGKIAAKYISVEAIESVISGQYEKNLETYIYTNDIILGLEDFNADGEVTLESQDKLNNSNNTNIVKKLLVGDFGKTIIYTKTVSQSLELYNDLSKLKYSVSTSNYEDDANSEKIKDFKKLSGNHILIVVDRCSEGFDDPNVSVIDFTYSRNIGLTYQRYSRAIRASKNNSGIQKKYIKVVPNDEQSANAYTHIMTAVKMLLKQNYYEAFNGKNFSIPTIKQTVKVDSEGCVKGYVEKLDLTVDNINAEIATTKSATPRTIEDLSNDEDFKVTVIFNDEEFVIKQGEFNTWKDKLENLDYVIKVEKTKNNIDNSLLMETSTLSGVYFDVTNINYDVTTQYAVSSLDKVLADIYEIRYLERKEKEGVLNFAKEYVNNGGNKFSREHVDKYGYARRTGFLDELNNILGNEKRDPNSRKEIILEFARNYNSNIGFTTAHKRFYSHAQKHGYVKELNEALGKVELTTEQIKRINIQKAKEYSQNGGVSMSIDLRNEVHHAKENGYIDEFRKIVGSKKRIKTKERKLIILNHAKSYKGYAYSKEFRGNYLHALEHNYVDELNDKLGKKSNVKWTLELCKEEALKYNTKGEWQKNSGGSYMAVLRNDKKNKEKWFEECTSHMVSGKIK